jgi:aminopeptidase-like protein
MVTREQFKLLQLCDGNNTLTEIAQITELGPEDLNKMMDELRNKGLIDIIIRS